MSGCHLFLENNFYNCTYITYYTLKFSIAPRFHEDTAFGLMEWIPWLYVDYENQIFLLDKHKHTLLHSKIQYL